MEIPGGTIVGSSVVFQLLSSGLLRMKCNGTCTGETSIKNRIFRIKDCLQCIHDPCIYWMHIQCIHVYVVCSTKTVHSVQQGQIACLYAEPHCGA